MLLFVLILSERNNFEIKLLWGFVGASFSSIYIVSLIPLGQTCLRIASVKTGVPKYLIDDAKNAIANKIFFIRNKNSVKNVAMIRV